MKQNHSFIVTQNSQSEMNFFPDFSGLAAKLKKKTTFIAQL